MKDQKKHIEKTLLIALKEDIGDGDHTSLACIPASNKGKARLLVKDNGVIAGVETAKIIAKLIDKSLKLKINMQDGALVRPGDVVFTIEGNERSILKAERLLLNFMQRMSGIATKTRELVLLCEGTKAKVIDTRKTTPGLRYFEKWAVRIGGGANHRFGLYDMILIKDNHIDYAGGIEQAIASANTYLKKKKKKLKIEIEARTLADVELITRIGRINRIMLDNFSPDMVKKALQIINGRFETEASGGITEANIHAYAQTGVDFISVGALTHNIRSLDLSLKVI